MASSAFAAGGGKDQFHNGSFRADDVQLNWTAGGLAGAIAGALGLGGGGKTGALVQSAQWTCQRTVNMLYEIGSTAVYYVGNRRQGQAQFTRVVAGSTAFKSLVTSFGNICAPQDLTIDAKQAACKGGTTTGGGVKYTLKSATLTSVGANVNANDIVINEQLGFMFVDLYYT